MTALKNNRMDSKARHNDSDRLDIVGPDDAGIPQVSVSVTIAMPSPRIISGSPITGASFSLGTGRLGEIRKPTEYDPPMPKTVHFANGHQEIEIQAQSGGRRSCFARQRRQRRLGNQPKLISLLTSSDICRVWGVFSAFLVRLILASFSLFTVWLTVTQLEDIRYWALASPNMLMIMEGAFTVVSRAGQERKWLCLCFVCYLMSCVPAVWLLELDRLRTSESIQANDSSVVTITVSELSAVIQVNASMALNVTEQGLVFLLIFGRWLLPRGDITRDMLSQLLFVFIGMASDVMELFQLFREPKVRHDTTLTYVILAIWTISLFQFTFVMTMSQSPKTAVTNDNTQMFESKHVRSEPVQLEVWSLLATLTMQDGPFLILRLYILLKFYLINYSIIFFTCKNGLVVLLLAYRFAVICLRRLERTDDHGRDHQEEWNIGSYNRSRRKIIPLAE